MATCPIVSLPACKPHRQQPGESRERYLARARRFCKVAERRLLASGEYAYCHPSFLVRDTLLAVEAAFPDLGTFGVEGIEAGKGSRSPAIDYLNTGDSYELTLLHVRGRYRVGCWGDYVERGNYS